MKRVIPPLMVVVLVALSSSALSQERALVSPAVEAQQASEPYPIPGSHLLRDEERKIWEYIREHPEVLQQQALMKKTAWTFDIGDPGPILGSGWWASDLSESPTVEYLVPSTCQAVGDNCYVFVENSLWGNRVTQAAVDSILAAWEERTPADPTKGIYRIDTETFGDPPNTLDNDPKIVILILDITDGLSGGSYVAGYFYSINQYQDGDPVLQGHRSNEAEIYYIDANPGDLNNPDGLTFAASTTAHEFQHMINWNYNKNTDTFNNEACSEVASLVCGYSYPGQNRYTDNTDIYLLGWNSTLADYSRAARWALYLWNQFPDNFLRNWVQNSGTGATRISNALAAYPTSRTFTDVVTDWLIANEVQDVSVNPSPRYGYTYEPSLTKPKATTHLDPNTGTVNGSVTGLGADYITFSSGSNLSVTFTSAFSNIVIKAIKIGAGSPVVEDVPRNTVYSVPDFGSTYSSVTFIVINTQNSTSSNSYSYSATGTGTFQTFEIKYEDGIPEGFLPLPVGDIQTVYFTGISGAKLDSIRVAFRRAGTMQTTLSRFNSSFNPSPIGQTIVPAFTLVSADSIQGYSGSGPYPVPYPNWVTIDLTQNSIDANPDFIISFVINNSTAPAVMISSEPDDGDRHSFTYVQSTGQWTVYGDQNAPGNVFKYLIRAYASIGTPVGTEVIELLPTSFSLKQNYPNPFNPSTTIKYDLPERTHVKLHIYDMLGRVVATLIDQEQSAGSYETRWDGTNLSGLPMSSGVYFYRLESGNFQEIKRMVLMK
ncbi:MAG TPA: T9SS type A sorting domain-containing protein [Bacteroidota bacterium]